MAIFRCNTCAHLAELPDSSIGETIPCAKCGEPAPVYGAVFFIGKLLGKYFDAQRDIVRLKAQSANWGSPSPVSNEPAPFDEIDLANTDQLASEVQHAPIFDWFKRKQIRVQFNTLGVDTTGFFDEVAVSIGSNLPVLKGVVDRVRWAQQKEYASTTIPLDKKSEQEAAEITEFCQRLYDFAFVAKCIHSRQENYIRLVVQTAPAIRNFFNGEWLEWYALMTCLQYTKQRKRRFSCARNLIVTLQNDESYELDVFMLIDGNQPLCIECKTGEFRQNIDKYLTLSKLLGIDGSNFIMCVTGLSDEHAKGLTAMYGLTFTNELSLATQLARLF
jgi:hypothetical protein